MPKSNIEAQIEAKADALAKSTNSPKELLIQTIKDLGAEGLRAKLPTLTKSEQEVVLAALQEMKKSVSMDKDYQAKFVQGKLTDTIIQEDKADDDQDEKLVKPEAAKQNHQGTPVEGWEGQVIKAEKISKEECEEAAEHEAKEEVKEHEKKMHKKDSKEMKKSEFDALAIESLKELRKSVEEVLVELGETLSPELVKSEMKAILTDAEFVAKGGPGSGQKGHITPEQRQLARHKMRQAMEARAKSGKDKEKSKEEKRQAQVKKESKSSEHDTAKKLTEARKEAKMKKSFEWGTDNELLKACTNGRNFTFSYEQYTLAKSQEEAQAAESLKKSEAEAKSGDVNDIIAKSLDTTWKDVSEENQAKLNKSKENIKLVKSFHDKEIVEALGLTEEEAKQILG